MVQMDYEPEGMKESVGSMVGLDDRRVKKDLEAFKDLIEATGMYRGSRLKDELCCGELRPLPNPALDIAESRLWVGTMDTPRIIMPKPDITGQERRRTSAALAQILARATALVSLLKFVCP